MNMTENNSIKKEIAKEVEDFETALTERNKPKPFKVGGHWTPEEIDAATKSMANSPQVQQAIRHNQGKVQWSLVDFKSFEPMVRVLEFGQERYGRNNWRKGMPATQIIESMLRHIYKMLDGELVDEESLLEHIGHIQCNAMFLANVLREKPEFNDLIKNTDPNQ